MALSSSTVWEVRATGSDSNAGGFRAGASGTDRSQQDAAHASGVNLTVDAATNTDVAPDGYTPVAADVGNLIQITAGAGFTAGFYEITAVVSGKWRLDRSPAAVGTAGGTWALGGAMASPGKAAGAVTGNNLVYVAPGTYTVTTTTANVSGGVVSFAASDAVMRGYGSSRPDLSTSPTIKAGVGITAVTLVAFNGAQRAAFVNLCADGSGNTSVRGFGGLASNSVAFRCLAKNCTNNGFSSPGGTTAFCTATGCSTQPAFSTSGHTIGCVAAANTVTGFSGGGLFVGCISANNTGASSSGFDGGNNFGSAFYRCIAYGNGNHGFSSNQTGFCCDLIAVNNVGWGFLLASPYGSAVRQNLAHYGNGFTGATPAPAPGGSGYQANLIALTAQPFIDPTTTLNFGLNPAGPDYSLLKGMGFGTYPNLPNTIAYLDIGAAQHQDAGGGGTTSRNPGILTGGRL